MKSITYTSTLSACLMEWVKKQAKKNNVTQREIIERALINLKNDVKRRELEDTFKRASKDSEVALMAEEGLEDTIEQLTKLT